MKTKRRQACTTRPSGSGRALGASLPAATGLAAALGAAFRCASPVVLAIFGTGGGARMFDSAPIARPCEGALLRGGAAALALARLLAPARPARACADSVRAAPGFRVPLLEIVRLGGGLAGLAPAAG
jgi:hypothetical protein